MLIDALQYIRPSRATFQQMRKGNLSAVHITVGYHEDFYGVVENLKIWNNWFANCEDLIARATTWNEVLAANKANKTAVLFGLQNPLPIGADIRLIEVLVQLGIRFCQITYNQQSLLGAGCFEPFDSGLTAFGREVVDEMNRVGMVIDLSHAGHKTAMDVINYSKRPVAVTHANPHDWYAAPRNLKQELIQAISETGGMLGFSLYPHHLRSGSDCTLQEFAEMVSSLSKTHGSKMFGIGSDLCQDQPDSVVNWMRNGNWRKEPTAPAKFPKPTNWFQTNEDFPRIANGLRSAKMTDTEIAGVLGENWMKFWQKAFLPNEG